MVVAANLECRAQGVGVGTGRGGLALDRGNVDLPHGRSVNHWRTSGWNSSRASAGGVAVVAVTPSQPESDDDSHQYEADELAGTIEEPGR